MTARPSWYNIRIRDILAEVMALSVLVCGGAGYIGSRVSVELALAGLEPVIADCDGAAAETALRLSEICGREIPSHTLDLQDAAALSSVFDAHPNIDAVIDLAGLKSVGESLRFPLEYYSNNLGSLTALLREMRRRGIKKLVFASSAAALSSGARSPYAAGKAFSCRIISDVCASDAGFGAVALHYHNVAGAGPGRPAVAGAGCGLIAGLGRVASGGEARLRIFGGDYPTRDGTAVRDYVHVCDAASAALAALKRLDTARGYTGVQIGSGAGSSVLDVLRAYERACGREIPYVIEPRRAGDAPVSVADAARAEREIGWRAALGLDEICKSDWLARRAEL